MSSYGRWLQNNSYLAETLITLLYPICLKEWYTEYPDPRFQQRVGSHQPDETTHIEAINPRRRSMLDEDPVKLSKTCCVEKNHFHHQQARCIGLYKPQCMFSPKSHRPTLCLLLAISTSRPSSSPAKIADMTHCILSGFPP